MLANVGIPMICVSLPTMLLALLPIALLEAWVLRRICSLTFSAAWRGALRANLWSTLLGVPIAWFILLVTQILLGGGRAWGLNTPLERLAAVTLQAPWLVPYSGHDRWMVPAASLVLLIPFFVASVMIEWRALLSQWQPQPARLFLGVVVANALSYLLLALMYGFQFWIAWQIALADPLAFVQVPDQLTLYSIDGRDVIVGGDRGRGHGVPPAIGEFHGYPILGKVDITDSAARGRLLRELKYATAHRVDPAACFVPRHGLRVVANGQITEFALCFECGWYIRFSEDLQLRGTISSDVREEFDKPLLEADVRIAPGSD